MLTFRGMKYDDVGYLAWHLEKMSVYDILSSEPADMIRAGSVLYYVINNPIMNNATWRDSLFFDTMYKNVLRELRKSGLMPTFRRYMTWLTDGKANIQVDEIDEEYAEYCPGKASFYNWLMRQCKTTARRENVRNVLAGAPLHIKRSNTYIEVDEYVRSIKDWCGMDISQLLQDLEEEWSDYDGI